jgi:hypothetical protein
VVVCAGATPPDAGVVAETGAVVVVVEDVSLGVVADAVVELLAGAVVVAEAAVVVDELALFGGGTGTSTVRAPAPQPATPRVTNTSHSCGFLNVAPRGIWVEGERHGRERTSCRDSRTTAMRAGGPRFRPPGR